MTAVQNKVDDINLLIDGINLLVRIKVPMLIQDENLIFGEGDYNLFDWNSDTCMIDENFSWGGHLITGEYIGPDIDHISWPTFDPVDFDFDEMADECGQAAAELWDNLQTDYDCCADMRQIKGYPPQGAANDAACEENYDCDSSFCSNGNCQAGLPNGFSCGGPGGGDWMCNSGNCKWIGVGSFCWGESKRYKLKLFNNGQLDSSTETKIDIYIVNDIEYSQSNKYQKKITHDNVNYNSDPDWTSDWWFCGDPAYDTTNWGYSTVVCARSSDTLYIDRAQVRKNCNVGKPVNSFDLCLHS